MVRFKRLCISSFQHNRSSYSKSQAGEVFGDDDYTMVENTVLVSHDGIITKKFPNTSSSKYTDFTIQKISDTPTLSKNEIIGCSFTRESLRITNFQRKLQMLSQICGEQPPKVDMNQLSDECLFMQLHGVRIPVNQM